MKTASFFDIDGTLFNGFIMNEFSKYLLQKNLFEKKYFEKFSTYIKDYQEKKITYRKASLVLSQIYALGLKGRKKKDIEREAKEFAKELTFFSYAMPLVKLMQSKGMTIAMSGAPIEPAVYLKDIFGFDLVYGTEVVVKDGVFTGEVKTNLVIREEKEMILAKIIKEHNIDLTQSFGFGDTEQDVSFLAKVGNPVALNPNSELRGIAKRNNWPCFMSDDDVLEEIENILKTKKKEIKGRTISKGSAEGEVILSHEPISFFGGVDPDTGVVVESGHELEGKSVGGKILVFPHGKGSTVGSYTLYRMKKNGVAPKAIVNRECEPIVAVGAIISEIPAIDMLEKDLLKILRNGQKVRVDADKGVLEL